MNKYYSLLKNIMLFGIGTVLSKIILFVLMPLYTSVLSTAEYGIAEMFSTSLELIFPLITLGISEAVFRYCIDKGDIKQETISIGFFVTTTGLILCIIIAFYFRKMLSDYFILYIFLIITYSYKTLFSYICRGLNKNSQFAFAGILNTLMLAICNIYFLIFLKIGLNGYLLAIIFSNLTSCIYFLLYSKVYKSLSIHYFKKNKFINMLKYSAPTILNQLSWWIINMFGRYVLLFFFNNSIVGLYTASSKVPSTINLVTQMFQNSWQFSSSQEKDNENSIEFYSKIYKVFLSIMIITTSIIITISPILSKIILKGEFYSSWKFIPLLLITAFLNSISMFFGTFYTAFKKSNMLMYSTIVGVFTNIIISIPLGYYFKIDGIAISGLFTYFVILIIRIYDTQKFVKIKLFKNILVILFILLVLQSFLVRINILYSVMITFLISIILCLFLKKQIYSIFIKFKKNRFFI